MKFTWFHLMPWPYLPDDFRTENRSNFCYGQITALTRDKYLEAHDLVMRAWRKTEPFAFDGNVIAGSPATVRERMEDLIKQLHVGHVFGLCQVGNMPGHLVRHSSKLFAEQVMPHLRNLWPDWADDKRWFPQPLADRRAMENQPSLARAVNA